MEAESLSLLVALSNFKLGSVPAFIELNRNPRLDELILDLYGDALRGAAPAKLQISLKNQFSTSSVTFFGVLQFVAKRLPRAQLV